MVFLKSFSKNSFAPFKFQASFVPYGYEFKKDRSSKNKSNLKRTEERKKILRNEVLNQAIKNTSAYYFHETK